MSSKLRQKQQLFLKFVIIRRKLEKYKKYYCFIFILAICYKGTYRNRSTNVCEPCPVGEYQPNDQQEECIKCPTKYSTESAGKNNITDCKCK